METEKLMKMDFPEDTKMETVFQSDRLQNMEKMETCKEVEEFYGELRMDWKREDRPFLFTSLVSSIDSKIAFSDNPCGPLIARMNRLDEMGAMSDWWVLNLLRSIADGILIGTGTLNAEADYSGHVFSQNLENMRIRKGEYPIPWNIIVSSDGKRIPYEHEIFRIPEIPVMICSSEAGLQYAREKLDKEVFVITEGTEGCDRKNLLEKAKDHVIFVITGEETPDTVRMMKILKNLKFDRILVETPGYMHQLLKKELLDELFLNYSCLYVGGKALGIGANGEEFTSEKHPHTKLLSIHRHSDSFFYFRHQFVYK